MGNNRNPRVPFICGYCKKPSSDKPSHYEKKKRHFCSTDCYSKFRRDFLPRNEQHAYGQGHSQGERDKRKHARSILNHAIGEGKITRKPCHICGTVAEAHHEDYSKPLDIKWLCFKHHRQYHYETPELMKEETK